MTKKQFCLEQLAPYFKNPKLCGYEETIEVCRYKGDHGTMCVFGKNLIEILPIYEGNNADCLLERYGQDILKPEARNILLNKEWKFMQNIHDSIATSSNKTMKENIDELGLFTYEELVILSF